jgi:hypothetical protein
MLRLRVLLVLHSRASKWEIVSQHQSVSHSVVTYGLHYSALFLWE